MSGVLNHAADHAYRQFRDHCNDCVRCNRGGESNLCVVGHRLLALWEHAEANAVVVA